MSDRITSKGLRWEILHSFFLVWNFVPLVYWIPIAWIGLRVRKWLWVLAAALYATPTVIAMVLVETAKGSPLEHIFIGLMFLAQIVAAVHGFMVRAEYLIRLETREQSRQAEYALLRMKASRDYGGPMPPAFPTVEAPAPQPAAPNDHT